MADVWRVVLSTRNEFEMQSVGVEGGVARTARGQMRGILREAAPPHVTWRINWPNNENELPPVLNRNAGHLSHGYVAAADDQARASKSCQMRCQAVACLKRP
eukprot:scaffold10084_cov139-Isochrysis_galbana.AAC.4